ncbi:MAG: PilZ domain-containing protein [Gammaproteobacteria bacterium]|nr:PilZ domain-containing protein [Gammaproteobacteria bacterium]
MTAERRRYYRIEDEVMISLTPIDATEVDQRLEDFWSNEHAFSIRNDYNFQISQHIADRHQINKKMPELGRYLSVLEKQIDRLTEKLLADEDEQSMTKKNANLSAQGISYYDDEAPPQDDPIELKLKLLPSGLRLVIIARVVLVEMDSDQGPGEYKISLDFEHLHEADREILIKHIHGKQMESLSSAKES